MDIYEAMKRRMTIREFSTEPIPMKLQKIIAAGFSLRPITTCEIGISFFS